MTLKSKLQLKKYQTQNFVNQYIQQHKYIYHKKLRQEALRTLQEEGFVKFEYRYILREHWTVGMGRWLNRNRIDWKELAKQRKLEFQRFEGNSILYGFGPVELKQRQSPDELKFTPEERERLNKLLLDNKAIFNISF